MPVAASQIHNHHIFVEPFGSREHAALRIEGAAAAVEDQIVVAAHLVDEHQRQSDISAAIWPSICSRRICLPTVKGEAERLMIACAPAWASTSMGSWW